MMRFALLFLYAVSLFAFEHTSNISAKYVGYDDFPDEAVILGDTKFGFENDAFKTDVTLDYLYSSEYKERRYLDLSELYLSKEYGDYTFHLGKIIKYWGEMEGFNVTDVFNQKNYLFDPFDKSAKLGSWSTFLTRYFDDNSLEFGVKLYEEDSKYPTNGSPYYPFAISYNKELQLSDERYAPTFYLLGSFTTDKYVDSETKLILLHGYDNKRYFIQTALNTLSQYAYRVNKFMLLSHIIHKDTIFKCEASYTDVISDTKMSDYVQFALGAEKDLHEIYGVDVSLYGEYYRYIYMQDKIKNVDISEIYDNDIFLALKLNLNDVRSSELKSGILYDLKNEEKVFKIEAKSRVIDSLVISSEYLHVMPAQNTVLSQIRESSRIMLGLTYTF
ncbi:hypothetical protein KKA17_09010 [bacterium]|nr:hypothetical protein [bacterium]MBU1883074.1 hypothetical protein [bacterium]